MPRAGCGGQRRIGSTAVHVCSVVIDAFGAAGADTSAGNGGEAHDTVPVTAGEVLQVNVGGMGQPRTAGGLNGGGPGG